APCEETARQSRHSTQELLGEMVQGLVGSGAVGEGVEQVTESAARPIAWPSGKEAWRKRFTEADVTGGDVGQGLSQQVEPAKDSHPHAEVQREAVRRERLMDVAARHVQQVAGL